MFVQATNLSNFNIQMPQKKLAFKALPIKYSEVDDFLIRGPHPSISDLILLKKEGVTQIYDFRHKETISTKIIEKVACKILGIKYNQEPYHELYQNKSVAEAFEEIAKSVVQNGEQGGKTLFHCNSGRHRTAHMSAFYELTKGKQTLEEVRLALGEKFGERVKGIVHTQIPSRTYRNRSIITYDGLNPITRYFVNQNNKYAIVSRRAQAKFMKLLFGLEE